MKIISFAAIKGGVGKTTLCYNWGEFLARKLNKKVLFIDMDNQCSLTQTFNAYDVDNNIGNIFHDEDAAPITIEENVDIISGNANLDNYEALIENRTNKNMLLFLWMARHDEALQKYDYVLIDCHPDLGTATKNAIIVSHAIFSPLLPNQYSYDSRENIEVRLENLKKEAVDYNTGNSYVTAELMFLLNRVRMNTHSSRELVENSKGDDAIIATIPERELFNKSTFIEEGAERATPLIEMEEDKKVYQRNQNFFKDIDKTFINMKEKVDTL